MLALLCAAHVTDNAVHFDTRFLDLGLKRERACVNVALEIVVVVVVVVVVDNHVPVAESAVLVMYTTFRDLTADATLASLRLLMTTLAPSSPSRLAMSKPMLNVDKSARMCERRRQLNKRS